LGLQAVNPRVRQPFECGGVDRHQEEEATSAWKEAIRYSSDEDARLGAEMIESNSHRVNESEIPPLLPRHIYEDQDIHPKTPEELPSSNEQPPIRRTQRRKVLSDSMDGSSSDVSSFGKSESPLGRYSGYPQNPVKPKVSSDLSDPRPIIKMGFLDLPLLSSPTSKDSTYSEVSSQFNVTQNPSPVVVHKDQAEENTNRMVTLLLDYICKELSSLSNFAGDLSCSAPSTSLRLNIHGNLVRTRPDLQITLERNGELIAILDYEVRIYPMP
jgi:hypothetical protein